MASLSCQECPLGFVALEDSSGRPVTGSANCRELNFITKCSSSEQYLNDSSPDINEWKCEQCPPGGACEGETVRWSTLRNLFGWWKVPPSERSGNASWKSTPSFAECMYPPACLGASNRALEKRYYSEIGVDLALVGRGNTTIPCAASLGFRNESRLCHACNATSRRESSARCTKCPDVEQNWSLMALGLLFAIGVVCFIVVGTIRDAGKQTLSSAIQKILLNYLQGEFVRLASGFSMCSFVRSRVCLRCAIKSKGCLLRQKIRSPEHYVFSRFFPLVPALLSRGARPGVSTSLAPCA